MGDPTAEQLYTQAADGTFRMDGDLARKCAATFLRFAAALDPQLARSTELQSLTGFGGFDSARQLRRGFEGKAAELTTTLRGLRETAVRMAEAYLVAGGLIEEADALHGTAVRAAAADLDP
ncbi:hypothetical protein HLB23_23840 [Nocardia uniformis]|uniref:Uncharacterized protein n=1 Tax=Nocardia uniformis TaxID=53432 RepID=A0A849C2C4_9NOCA|nr:hypothetical protein [Nocardia uniformis]